MAQAAKSKPQPPKAAPRQQKADKEMGALMNAKAVSPAKPKGK